MAKDPIESFLQAEQDAHLLVEELTRLRGEVVSFNGAKQALDSAAEGLGTLSTHLTAIADRLGGVTEALRTIGTPELLRAQEAATSAVSELRKDVVQTQGVITSALDRATAEIHALRTTIDETLISQIVSANATVRTIRLLSIGGLGLLLLLVIIVVWRSS